MIGHLGEATGTSGEVGNEPLFQPISHLGEATRTFSVNPTVLNSAGVFGDLSTAFGIAAPAFSPLSLANKPLLGVSTEGATSAATGFLGHDGFELKNLQ